MDTETLNSLYTTSVQIPQANMAGRQQALEQAGNSFPLSSPQDAQGRDVAHLTQAWDQSSKKLRTTNHTRLTGDAKGYCTHCLEMSMTSERSYDISELTMQARPISNSSDQPASASQVPGGKH